MTRSIVASVVALLFTASIVSCSSSGSSAPPPICSSLHALKSSVNQLSHLNASTTSVQDVKHKLTAVSNDVHRVAKDASSRYSSQVDNIKKNFAAVQTGITHAISNPSASSISQISTQVSALRNSVSTLHHDVASTC